MRSAQHWDEVQAFWRATLCACFNPGFPCVNCSPVTHRSCLLHAAFLPVFGTSVGPASSLLISGGRGDAATAVMSQRTRTCIMQALPALALTLLLLPCVMSMYTAGEPTQETRRMLVSQIAFSAGSVYTLLLTPGDKVKVLTAKNFNSAILQSDVPAVGTATIRPRVSCIPSVGSAGG